MVSLRDWDMNKNFGQDKKFYLFIVNGFCSAIITMFVHFYYQTIRIYNSKDFKINNFYQNRIQP